MTSHIQQYKAVMRDASYVREDRFYNTAIGFVITVIVAVGAIISTM